MTMNEKKLFLIDGMSHIYRAYYAVRNLSNSRGLPTGAVFGFTSMLRKLIDAQKPDYIGVAMDLEGAAARREKYADYKATRKPMPEDLRPQIPYIRRVCEAFRIPVIDLSGHEADDVIGTLAKKAGERNLQTVIVTSDKDMLQLVADDVAVLDTMKDNLFIDAAGVEKKLGVRPDQVADLLGLWGDASDNIPGAPGIGEKGARELMQAFDTLDNLLANYDKVKKKAQMESLRDNREIILMSRELATIRRDLPVELNLEELALGSPDRKAAFELFSELGFKSLTEEFFDAPIDAAGKPLKGKWLTEKNAEDFFTAAQNASRVYVDIRCSENMLERRKPDTACVLYGESGEVTLIDLGSAARLDDWRRLTENSAARFVCWDAKLFLETQDILQISAGRVPDDVMLMAFLTAPNAGDFSINRWALDEARVSLAVEKQPRQASFLQEPERNDEILCRRMAALRRLDEILNARLDEMGLRKLYKEIDLPLAPVLAGMERAGVKVDRATLKEMSVAMEKNIADLTGRVYRAAGMEFNINSPKQLGEILFEKLNLPVLKKTRKTGGYSTDQGVLEELAQTYELPRLILEYRQVAKLILQVHDELVLEAPEAETEAAGRIVKEKMEGTAELLVPLKVDLNVADNWMDMK